ncbi:MAG: hypothetical protein AAF675_00505 [Pseudomonadota bacterium]
MQADGDNSTRADDQDDWADDDEEDDDEGEDWEDDEDEHDDEDEDDPPRIEDLAYDTPPPKMPGEEGPLRAEPALHQAVREVMAALGAAVDRQRRLATDARLAAARVTELSECAERLIQALPRGERREHGQRLAVIHSTTRPNSRPRPGGPAEALRWFLVHRLDESFRPADAHHWLQSEGWPYTRRQTTVSLGKLHETGYIKRVAHGVYRPNSAHPVLCELALSAIKAEIGNIG